MKSKIIFILIFIPFLLAGQSINGKPLSEIKTKYIQIRLGHINFSKKSTVRVNYGKKENKSHGRLAMQPKHQSRWQVMI